MDSVEIGILIGFAFVLLFGCVIYLSLRYRDRKTAANLLIKFTDIKARLPMAPEGQVRYGVFQDFSALDCGYLVRNTSDEEVGTIRYKVGRRSGWLEIKIADALYQASTLNAWRRTIVLHRAGDDKHPIVTMKKDGWFKTRYEISGGTNLERTSQGPAALKDSLSIFTSEGRTVGYTCAPGGSNFTRVASISLPVSEPVLLFLLAVR